MATNAPITLHEGNDETVTLTITADPGDDLDAVTALELYLKDDACDSDDDATLVLTTADPTEITITAQDADGITAEAYIPGTALTDPYPRQYRVDTIGVGGVRRTALYGVVTIVDL